MNQNNISVHPIIIKTIQNLDLDLESQLSQFEESRLHNTALITQPSNQNNMIDGNDEDLYVVYQSATLETKPTTEGENTVSVSSTHKIEPPDSFLDRILTPWGIFGIIFFITANILIIFHLDNQNTAQPNQTGVSTNSTNEDKIEQTNSTSLTTEILNTNIPSPYSDLKTALFTEIENQESTSSTQLQTNPKDTSSSQNLSQTNSINQTTNSYHIISNYKNMNQFNKIKKKVPSAVITTINKKMKIRLEVVKDKTQARKKSQQLENQGIDNYIEEYK